MSKLFGRVGTSAMKYQFELTVNSLHMSIPLTTPMCVKWTRGPRTATNQPVAGVNGEYNWPAGKAMMIIATMYFKKNSFQEKKSKLTVKQLLGKDLKSVGQVEIDLAQFCGEGETTKSIQLKLQKCSDKGAYLKCTMKSRWLKQLADGADDTASQMSGASSVDARSESAMPHMHAHHTAGGDVANLNDLDGMEEEEHDDTEYSTSRASPSTSRASPSASPSASTGVESRPVRIVSYDPSSTSVNAAMSTPSRSINGGVGGLNSSPVHAGGGSMTSSIPSTPNNNAQAMATIQNLQLQLDTLNQTLATKDAQLNQRENELDVLKLKIADLTVNWNAERTQASKLSGLQSQLSQLQTSYDTVVREKHDLETEHEQALVRVRTELVEMTKKCEEIQRHHLDAERQLAQTKVELEQTKTKLNAAESAVSVAASASATSSPSPATGPTSPSSTGADRSQLESQVRSLRAELTEASALTHEAFQRLENVEAKARQTAVEHEKELVNKDKEIRTIEERWKEAQKTLHQTQDELKLTSQQVIESRRIEKELKNELALVQSSVQSEISKREALETNLDESERQLQEARTQAKKAEMEKETELKHHKQAWTSEREKLTAELHEVRQQLEAASAAATPTPASDALSPATNEFTLGLQKKIEDYAQRILAFEEERQRYETEIAELEATLSKQKEEELSQLEERYEETFKFKRSLKEKEQEVEDLHKQTREAQREAKELRLASEKQLKELREKTKLIDQHEQQIEALNTKCAKLQEEHKKHRLLIDTSSSRIRELEMKVNDLQTEKESLEGQVKEKESEVASLQQKRTELVDEFEREKLEWKKQLTQQENDGASNHNNSTPAPVADSSNDAASDDNDTTAAAAASTTSSSSSEEFAHLQSLCQKRTLEIEELETQIQTLRTKLRASEELEERYTKLEQRTKESEATWTKKYGELQKLNNELESSLAVLKEKRDRDRTKLDEREAYEKDLRLQSTQQLLELNTTVTTLTNELEEARTKIDELQDASVTKSSKISEQQDRLNTLTRTSESSQRELAEQRELVTMLTTKLETATNALNEATKRLENEKATHTTEVERLQKQLEDLTQRKMIFDKIEEDALLQWKKDHSKTTPSGLLESLQQKIQFYEDQLADADESMVLAKASFTATSNVLVQQVEQLELQVKQLKEELATALESKGMDATKMQQFETKLKKAEKDKSKLSELMSRFEVELTQKKCELAASLDQLATQEYENEKLKSQLSKQLKLCEGHIAELNKARET